MSASARRSFRKAVGFPGRTPGAYGGGATSSVDDVAGAAAALAAGAACGVAVRASGASVGAGSLVDSGVAEGIAEPPQAATTRHASGTANRFRQNFPDVVSPGAPSRPASMPCPIGELPDGADEAVDWR